jgi:bacteriocin biosynthesis cyclodehydratase domain-containing protein
VNITRTDAGVILRSDLAAHRASGTDASAFADEVMPLLDGTRSEDDVIRALPAWSRESVLALLGWLRGRRLLADDADAPPDGQAELFRAWKADVEEAMRRLREARVLVVGGEPWGATAAIELRAAGVGVVEVSADAASLNARRPWDLVVSAVAPRDEGATSDLARRAHDANVVSLWAHLSGTKAFLGPLVTPGRTACRACAEVDALNPSLVVPGPRMALSKGEPLLETVAARRLGCMLAMEVVRVLTSYAPSALGGRLLIEDFATFETTLYTLVRLPTCRVCSASPKES